MATPFSRAVLGPFISWLLETKNLSQSDVMRRTGVSQGWISRMISGSSRGEEGSLTTAGRLLQVFQDEWAEYLASHPAARKELEQRFGWLLPRSQRVRTMPAPARRHPAMAEAIEYLNTAFSVQQPSYHQFVLAQLRTLAEHARTLAPSAKASSAQDHGRRRRKAN